MIELQGDLVKKTEWGQSEADLEVRDGTPFLTIGIHELVGIRDLKKPFVVLDPQQEEDETSLRAEAECRSLTVAGAGGLRF